MRFCLYVIAVTVLLAPAAKSGSLASTARRGTLLNTKVVPVVKADPRSGQLVKTIVITPQPSPARAAQHTNASEIKNLAESAAKNYDVPLALVDSVIQVESNYDPLAVSAKGAQGVMQLMPATARRFGVKDTFDPKQNIEGGVRYLKFLQETFKNDRLAIAAYNAGEGAVVRYGDVPPYPETIDYVAKVGRKLGKARQAEAVKHAVVEKSDNGVQAPEFRPLAQIVGADGKMYLTTQ